MNLSELKNLDIGLLFKKLLNNNASLKGPQAKIILWSALGALIFVAYIVLVFMPYLAERDAIEHKIAAIPEMEAKIKYLEIANRKAHEDLVQTEMNYIELNRLFSVESELEELYQRLSQMATSQGLTITSLATDGEEAIYPGGKPLPAGQAPKAPGAPPAPNAPNNPQAGQAAPPAPPLFYRIKLKVEMSGNYSRYMRYRKLLAGFEKSVNIDKEQITLVSGDTHGLVQIKAQLSTYRLPEKLQTKIAVLPQSDRQSDSLLAMVGGVLQKMSHYVITSAVAAAPKANNAVKNQTAGLGNNEEVIVNANPADLNGRANERDPFSKSSSGMIEGGKDPRYSPLVMADPQSYIIMGVVVSNSVKAAMIRTDFRESFVVKVGDRLGNQGGIISDIDLDGVILRQPNGKVRLFLQSQPGQFPVTDPNKAAGGAR
jgi:Tfp pilus assembly protein PilO